MTCIYVGTHVYNDVKVFKWGVTTKHKYLLQPTQFHAATNHTLATAGGCIGNVMFRVPFFDAIATPPATIIGTAWSVSITLTEYCHAGTIVGRFSTAKATIHGSPTVRLSPLQTLWFCKTISALTEGRVLPVADRPANTVVVKLELKEEGLEIIDPPFVVGRSLPSLAICATSPNAWNAYVSLLHVAIPGWDSWSKSPQPCPPVRPSPEEHSGYNVANRCDNDFKND